MSPTQHNDDLLHPSQNGRALAKAKLRRAYAVVGNGGGVEYGLGLAI
jgi:hypothetical protein